MSDQPKFGELVTDLNAKRDAIHVAVCAVEAAAILYPSLHVGLTADGKAVMTVFEKRIGIVDPFLEHKVMPGDRFWLFLYPGTITGLRHAWTHPAFPEDELTELRRRQTIAKENAGIYLDRFAERIGQSLQDVREMFDAAAEGRDYTFGHTFDDVGYGYDHEEEAWAQWEIYTGKKRPENRALTFHCAC